MLRIVRCTRRDTFVGRVAALRALVAVDPEVAHWFLSSYFQRMSRCSAVLGAVRSEANDVWLR